MEKKRLLKRPIKRKKSKRKDVAEDKIYICSDVYNRMVTFCEQQLPFEACGLLSGKGESIQNIFPLENIEKSTNSFAIGEQDFKETLNVINKRDEEFNGVFHSHPAAVAYPSYSDIDNAYSSSIIYIIISFMYKKPVVKAFYIKGKSVIPAKVQMCTK